MPFFYDLGVALLMVASGLVYSLDEESYPKVIKFVDPCLALASVAFLVLTSISLIKSLALILLQASDFDVGKIKKAVLDKFQQEILDIHEFHVWNLMHGQVVANLHVTFLNAKVKKRIDNIIRMHRVHPTQDIVKH